MITSINKNQQGHFKSSAIKKIYVTNGVYFVDIPEIDLRILCGCPADVVKHLLKRGLIQTIETNGVLHENGPNAILLSDLDVQGESFSNMAEFPVLQMLYRQGMLIPDHPNNDGRKPLLIGNEQQIKAQLEYIYRGNYGLVSEDELIEAGASAGEAKELMQIKLKFAFGEIKNSDTFLETLILGREAKEIVHGAFIKRLHPNIFEISYKGESIQIDLNLKPNETYESPLNFVSHFINREYFAVLHTGEGDGWDTERPAMASILMYQGKIFLIDAGAATLDSLKSLGIGVNELEGIFHTHSHDDHFAGLPNLMRTDKKIKYFSTSIVRKSVIKKLTALLSTTEEEINRYFDFRDLTADTWNNIDGLEVKPTNSPHPVENVIFQFRSLWHDGYRTYAHLADICAFDYLDQFINQQNKIAEKAKTIFCEPTTLKKIDIGGGMIHGRATDFKNDQSKKIVLAHTSLELDNEQKEIGSSASFGTVDVLIPNTQSQELRSAYYFFQSDFPTLIPEKIRMLLNNETVLINPEEILIKEGEVTEFVYLIMSGYAEMIHASNNNISTLYAGSMLGELSALYDRPSRRTYRSKSYIRALKIPARFYREFIHENGLMGEIERTQESWIFLSENKLFDEGVSYATINDLVKKISLASYSPGTEINLMQNRNVQIIKSGKIGLFLGDILVEELGTGSFFGESSIIPGELPEKFKAKVIDDVEVYLIPGVLLNDIPVTRWKMFQSKRQRVLNASTIARLI